MTRATSLPPSMKLPAAPYEVVQPQYKLSGECQDSCQMTYEQYLKKNKTIKRHEKTLFVTILNPMSATPTTPPYLPSMCPAVGDQLSCMRATRVHGENSGSWIHPDSQSQTNETRQHSLFYGALPIWNGSTAGEPQLSAVLRICRHCRSHKQVKDSNAMNSSHKAGPKTPQLA